MKKLVSIAMSIVLIFTTVIISNIHALESDTREDNDDVTEEEKIESIENEQFDNLENQEVKENFNNLDEQESINKNQDTILPKLLYSTHVQETGWQSYVEAGNIAGTSGQSKRLEAIKIKLDSGSLSGGISYCTHIQNLGWSNYVANDAVSGTTGKSLRLEAIKIKLTGEISNYYDIYYRVHVQNFGWLDWACNGKAAGSQTYGYRLEAIEMRLVKKGEGSPGPTNTSFKAPGKIYYSTHVQDLGWLSNTGDGRTSGTVGQSKRIEGLKINISDLPYEGNVEYNSHIQNIGWQSYKTNEELSGTVGQKLRIEAVKIRLTGEVSNYYDVYYRVHVQNFGWLDWAKNDEKAGTETFGYRIEAIEIKLVEKNGKAPGNTSRPFIGMGNVNYASYVQGNGWMDMKANGSTSGTIGLSKRIEAVKISLGENDYNGSIQYSGHVQDYGWMDYVSDGEVCGVVGESKKIEAVKIRLTGEIENYYDVYYRVHVQELGWLDWAKNDQIAGTVGGSFRVEAIEIKLYPKGVNVLNNGIKRSITFINKNGYKTCYDGLGRLYEDAESLLGKRSSYVLRVNKGTNVVTVLIQDGTGAYNIAFKRFVCSVGNDTPVGTYYTPAKYRWKELMGPSYGQYSTRIVGGILFHSVPYNKMNIYTLSPRMYNQLGTTCSHGCVRLTCGDAKWIYDNCVLGTRVDIIASGSDPLSKPSAQKLPLSQTWDPTDPNI